MWQKGFVGRKITEHVSSKGGVLWEEQLWRVMQALGSDAGYT